MKTLLALGALAASVWLLTSYVMGASHTYRYRLTLEIERDGRVHAGSSVVEVTVGVSSVPLSPHFTQSARGDAALVDLGDGVVVVALLEGVLEEAHYHERRSRDWIGVAPTSVLSSAYGIPTKWVENKNPGLQELVKARGKKEIALDQLPTLISFTDLQNPATAFVVRPDRLEPQFGIGARIARATIEITEDPITRGLERRLPWLRRVSNYLSGKSHCGPDTRPLDDPPICPRIDQLTR